MILLGEQTEIEAGAMGRLITELEQEAGVTVGLVRLTDLAIYERNARTHPLEQIEEIKASIRAFGLAERSGLLPDRAHRQGFEQQSSGLTGGLGPVPG